MYTLNRRTVITRRFTALLSDEYQVASIRGAILYSQTSDTVPKPERVELIRDVT